MIRRYHKLIFGMLLLAAVGFLGLCHRYLPAEPLVAHEQQLRRLVVHRPLVAIPVGFVAYTALSLVPGTTGKSIVFGWLFGFWWGVVQVNLGLTVAAVLTFLLSRYVLHDWVQSRFSAYLHRLNAALRRDGALLLVTLRLLHAPYTLVNYTAAG